jgi:acetyltransferase
MRDGNQDVQAEASEQRVPLDAILSPHTVAVIGATERPGSVGRAILWNLISNPFGGTVYPVNPNRPNVLGIRSYRDIAAIPELVDLAIIVTPAPTVPTIIHECAEAGIKGVVIISAGFKEVGPQGLELERQILQHARPRQMRLIGPNCLGVMRPTSGLNATFAANMARPGTVGFLSQSGALCTAVLDWSLRANVGFSAFVSTGSMLDIGWGDLIDYLADDPHTRCIVIYMESIGDARSFLSAAREVALAKPIIVIKAGRTEAAAKAAASHTGALTGSDEVLDAAFRRVGVLRVGSISQIFDMAEVLAKQPRPSGPRLAIITNAGGPGVLATDALIENRGELAPLSPGTLDDLNAVLPPAWSHGNPLDILGDADPTRYAESLKVSLKDPSIDGVLVILTPQAMTDATQTAEALRHYAKIPGKPVLASWMGGDKVQQGIEILDQAGIPTFAYPDSAAEMFSLMWRAHYNLLGLYETPELPAGELISKSAHEHAETIITATRQQGRSLLTEFESKQILAAYGIPTVETHTALTEDEAIALAESIGFPVALKLHSETVTHKTDVGGVQLNLTDSEAVRWAYHEIEDAVCRRAGPEHFQGVSVQPMVDLDGYELIIGSSLDPQFGPVLLFGTGGQLVEVFKDRALALPPLNTTLARRMMEQTQIFTALKGIRGRPRVDMSVLAHLVVRFSYLVVEQRWIKEIEINPLLVSSERLLALDARVILHPPHTRAADLPQLAIRPYPTQYVTSWTAGDGTSLVLRPIRPEDEPLIAKFHNTLSERTVSLRYFHAMKLSARVAHERLTRICFIDYDREIALVADHHDPLTGTHSIRGVGRLSRTHTTNEAEFALLISDRFQGQGLGTALLAQLLHVARQERITRISGLILAENTPMQHLCSKLGFRLTHHVEDSAILALIDL